jgi:DNA-binding NtrC family response regulator
MQGKLLRALETGEIRPLGGKQVRCVDVRIISASNRDLRELIREGRFREDLYFRINVIRIDLPPLRERLEDLPLLAEHFLREQVQRTGQKKKRLSREALGKLLKYHFPGNVRELKNLLERASILCPAEVIEPREIILEAARPVVTAEARADRSPVPPGLMGFLNPRQKKLLEILNPGELISSREYAKRVATSERTALRDLKGLVEIGVMRREGKRKGALYGLV